MTSLRVGDLNNESTEDDLQLHSKAPLPTIVVGKRTLVATGHVTIYDTNFSTGVELTNNFCSSQLKRKKSDLGGNATSRNRWLSPNDNRWALERESLGTRLDDSSLELTIYRIWNVHYERLKAFFSRFTQRCNIKTSTRIDIIISQEACKNKPGGTREFYLFIFFSKAEIKRLLFISCKELSNSNHWDSLAQNVHVRTIDKTSY